MNPHLKLLEETVEVIGEDKWVEVCYKDNGFTEVDTPQRLGVHFEDFLEELSFDVLEYRTCVIHILLGWGVDKKILFKTVDRASRLFDRVFILEHDRDSADWDNEEVRNDHFIDNCITGEEFLKECAERNWRHTQTIYVDGIKDGKRNMIIELDGKRVRYVSPFTEIQRHEISYQKLRDVYLGNCDDINLLDGVYDKIKAYDDNISEDTKLYASCGGFLSLNIIKCLTQSPIKKVIFYDINPHSVYFAQVVTNIIKSSKNIKDFLQNYFLLKVTKNEEGEYSFLPTSWDERQQICERNFDNYNKDTFPLIKLILNSCYDSQKLYIYGLMNVGGDSVGYLRLKYGVRNYENNNAMEVGHGWLKSEESFAEVKDFLSEKELEFIHSDIDELKVTDKDLLLASNILEFKRVEAFRKGKYPSRYNCMIVESEPVINKLKDHYEKNIF